MRRKWECDEMHVRLLAIGGSSKATTTMVSTSTMQRTNRCVHRFADSIDPTRDLTRDLRRRATNPLAHSPCSVCEKRQRCEHRQLKREFKSGRRASNERL